VAGCHEDSNELLGVRMWVISGLDMELLAFARILLHWVCCLVRLG